jgi:NADH-quinone oxidoreductase subunit H
MTWAELILSVVKSLVIILFLLNMALLTVWIDRRQSAMVQDRVGPNRAVVYLNPHVARVLLVAPAILVAAVFSINWWHPARGIERARVTTALELAVLVGWISLVLLCSHVRKRGADNAFERAVGELDPRHIFYGGLLLHLLVLVVVSVLFDRLHLPYYDKGGVQWGAGLSGALAAMVMMFSAFYAASKVPDEKVGLRLAGLLHGVADPLKLIWKEDLRPKNADRLLFALAPLLAMFPALVVMGVVPFGPTLCFEDVNRSGALEFGDLLSLAGTINRTGVCAAGQLPVSLQVADLDVGLLYIFAITGTGIIGAALAGWASDSKFALLGGLRATSQMVSYEVALGLAIVPILMVTGTLHMKELVDWQAQNTWGIFVQPFAFLLFLTALVAETKRVPFDQPEGESEIVAGYFLEYSGMKFGLFFAGEYAEFVFSSVLLTTLFFGGYHLPFLDPDGIRVAFGSTMVYELPMSHLAVSLLQVAAFFGKVIVVVFLQVFIRWSLPRFRYDQLMKLGWTKLLPLALANIVLTALVMLGVEAGGESLSGALDVLFDISQGVIAVGGLLAAVALVTWLLEPQSTRRLVHSTSARFANAAGGVKPTQMQA